LDLPKSSEIESINFGLLESGSLNHSRPEGRSRQARPARGLLESGGWMEVVPWRLVGTCVFGLALVAAMFLDLRPREQQVADRASLPQPLERFLAPPAATLISAIDCQWQHRQGSFEEGTSIHSGQLDLLSGTADLLFSNGARVILEGPARLVVQDAGRA